MAACVDHGHLLGGSCVFGRCHNDTCICDQGFMHDTSVFLSTRCDIRDSTHGSLRFLAVIVMIGVMVNATIQLRRLGQSKAMLLRGIAFATWFAELVTLILYVIVALQNGQQTHPKLIVLLTFVAIILGIHQCNWYMLVVFRLLMNSNKRIRGQLMRASRITFRIINVVCVSLFIVGGVALLTSSAEAKAVNAIMLWFNVGFWLVLAMLAIRTVETLQQVIVQFESVLEIEKNDSVATFVRRLRNMQRVVIGSVLVALLAIGSSVVLGFGFDWNPSLIFFSMPFTKVLFAIVMWFLLHKFEARPKSVQPASSAPLFIG